MTWYLFKHGHKFALRTIARPWGCRCVCYR